jgi:hypothetical protein
MLNSKIEIEKEFVKNLTESENIFNEILKVCNNNFSLGTGSYLFDGKKYEYCDGMFEKQLLLFEKVKNINSVLEIGTYMGHSLLIMLLSNPKLKITCIDIDDTYALPSIDLLRDKFNADITFIKGDSLNALSLIKEKYDLFHIDGTHKIEFVEKEFNLCKNLSSSNIMNVIFDDYDTISNIKNTIIKEHEILEQITPNCSWRNSYLKIKL